MSCLEFEGNTILHIEQPSGCGEARLALKPVKILSEETDAF